MSNHPIPGQGLSWTQLCDTGARSPERDVWRGLAMMAELLGIPSSRSNGPTRLMKTVDKLLTDLDGRLPEGADPAAVAHACLGMAAHRPAQVVYEVHHLRQVGNDWQWVPFQDFLDQASAEACRDEWAEQTGEPYMVVQVTTSTDLAVIEPSRRS